MLIYLETVGLTRRKTYGYLPSHGIGLHRYPATGTKLYCLMIGAHVCEQLAEYAKDEVQR